MYWLFVASILSGMTALLHFFGGGKSAAKPLLESSLDSEAKYTNYYCWHMVTIIIVAMSVCFFISAIDVQFKNLGIFSAALSFSFALWSCLLILIKKQNPFVLPQWVLFFPIAILGAVGVS